MARGRSRKPRLSRMDAAVDAMVPFGFPVEKIKKCVKTLLQVYGGDSGWPFVEEYGYKELIEAMLRDVEEVAEAGNESKEDERQEDEGPENDSVAGSSGAVAKPESSEIVGTLSMINNGDDLQSRRPSPTGSLSLTCTTPQLVHAPQRRRPCYGWIESDEEDVDDFVYLKPAFSAGRENEVPVTPSQGTNALVHRRSRWDLRPDDL